jgi:hypothetical protein
MNTNAVSRKVATCLFLPLVVLAGCLNTQMIQVTVTNTSTESLSTIEIGYPEATFGINLLAPGKSFRYKVKATATGPMKIRFFSAHGVNRTAQGPVLHKNEEGSIEINLTQDGASVSTTLR